MASQFTPYAPIGALNNADVFAVEQRTGRAFGRDYRYYVATMKDGAEWRLRSVTSILGVLNKEALIQWAVDQSMDYIRERVDYDADGVARFTQPDMETLLREARMAHYRTKTEAANLGTIAHDYVEAFLRTGQEQDMSDQDARVANCYDLFRRWWDQAGLSVIQTELMVYHAPLGYAGQLDFLAADAEGNPVLVDWKTSKAVYWNYNLQVVAYAKACARWGAAPSAPCASSASGGRTRISRCARFLGPTGSAWGNCSRPAFPCQTHSATQNETTARPGARSPTWPPDGGERREDMTTTDTLTQALGAPNPGGDSARRPHPERSSERLIRAPGQLYRAPGDPGRREAALGNDITEVYAEAKLEGFDPKVLRMLLKLRAMDDREEFICSSTPMRQVGIPAALARLRPALPAGGGLR